MPIDDDHIDDDLIHRRLFMRSGVAAFAAFVSGSVVQAAERAGSIEDIKGEGFAEAGMAQRALALEAPVFIADRVRTGTGSRLTLQLGRQTKVRLGESARITIDRYLVERGGDLTLESGAVLFDRPAGAPPMPVQIRSSFGLIAVRGTRFFAGPSGNLFGVFVARGSVAVSGGGRQVILHAGEGTDIRYPGDPPTPPKRWGPPRIAAAMASVA